MKCLKIVLILFAVFSLNASVVSAETVLLKSGKKVEGKIVEKNDSFIKVEFFGVPLTYYISDIESIDGKPVQPQQSSDLLAGSPQKQISPEQPDQRPKTAKEALALGTALALKGEYERAIAFYNGALKMDRNLYLALFLKGVAKDKLGKQGDALNAYVLVQNDYNIHYLKLLYTRWVVYREKGLLEQVISDLDKKIKAEPLNQTAYNDCGFLSIMDGDIAKAGEYINKAISLDPRYADAYVNRGILRAIQGDIDLAKADYDKAVALDPRCVDAYVNLGIVFLDRKQYKEALDLFSKAIKISPRYEIAYIASGITEQRMSGGQFTPSDAALDYFNKTLSINPDCAIAYFYRAIEYSLRGQMNLAIDDYSKAIALYPDDYRAYTNRALTYQRIEEYDMSISDATKAIGFDADGFSGAYFVRATGYLKKGQYDKAWDDVHSMQSRKMPIPQDFLDQLKKASRK